MSYIFIIIKLLRHDASEKQNEIKLNFLVATEN